MAFLASCFGICRGMERSRGEEEEEWSGQVHELPGFQRSSHSQQGGGSGTAPARHENSQDIPARPVSKSFEAPGGRPQASQKPTRSHLIGGNSPTCSKGSILSELVILRASQSAEPSGTPPHQSASGQAGPVLLLSSNSISNISHLDTTLPSKRTPSTSTHPSPLGGASARGRNRGQSIDLPRLPAGGLSRPSLRWQPPRQLQGPHLVRASLGLDRGGSLGNGIGTAAHDPPQSKTRAMLDFRMARLVATQPSKYKCLQQHASGSGLASPPNGIPGAIRTRSGAGFASFQSSASGGTIPLPTRTVSLSPSPNGISKLMKL